MSKTFDFIQECGPFHVATVNGDAPASRPFGAMMNHRGTLYICTSTAKDVYAQLQANPAVVITALKPGTMDWVRVNAVVKETDDLAIKQAMLDARPTLVDRYQSADNPAFSVLALTEMKSTLYAGGKAEEID